MIKFGENNVLVIFYNLLYSLTFFLYITTPLSRARTLSFFYTNNIRPSNKHTNNYSAGVNSPMKPYHQQCQYCWLIVVNTNNRVVYILICLYRHISLYYTDISTKLLFYTIDHLSAGLIKLQG